MTMTVRYNGMANRALSHTDKNNKASSKALAKLASGLKINSAADDAASFSIGARMRVKLRALDQDSQNVQNGKAILNTAEGGIQGQIELLKTIREKVIDAANDSNTDDDRLTIQKELAHLYDEMQSLAYGTDFNSKKPLLADKIVRLNEDYHTEVDNTKLNLIRDAEFEVLDRVYGPFAAFEEYSANATSTNMSGGTDGTPKIMSIDFSSFSNAGDLENVGISVSGVIASGSTYSRNYVFTSNTGLTYNNISNKVWTGNSVSNAIDNFVQAINNNGGGMTAVRDGQTVKLTTVNKSSAANNASVSGINNAGGTFPVRVIKIGTGAGISGTTSGGYYNPANDPDLPPSSKATLTVNLSGVTSNTGFRFNNYNFRVLDAGASGVGTVNCTLTKGQSSNGYVSNFSYTFDGANLTFTANSYGEGYNNIGIIDGYYYYEPDPNNTVTYTSYTAFDNSAISMVQTGADGDDDFWNLELSTVDDFSNKYSGKSLTIRRYYNSPGSTTSTYKFYDSSKAPKLEGFEEDSGSRAGTVTQIDINEIRQSVANGSTLAAAVSAKIGGTVNGDAVKFTSSSSARSAGNYGSVTLTTETLRHYDINFSNLGVKIPDGLYGKGFRFYCATDNKEWFNIVFTDGTDSYDSDLQNIKSINIDVSAVTNVDELLTTIYNQATLLLEGDDPKYNHHMRLAADYDKKILTIYDHRRFNVSGGLYNYQEKGAKIADGVAFKEVYENERRNFSVKELVIQHTDRADMNIKIKIPQMTLDHIFDPLPDYGSTIFDYPVTSKDSRDALLGKPNPPGILDIGLKYLLDAATMVGAQNRRLEFTATNITTEIENLTASESTISDADMAKEMTSYTKYNILTQSSQAMLAQANQNQSMVLSLLQ